MTAAHTFRRQTPSALEAAIARACARIAPSWPLDQFIAVNPFWGFVDEPLPDVAAKLAALSGARLLMPRSWFRAQWRAGRFEARRLEQAIAEAGGSSSVAQLLQLLDASEPSGRPRALLCDVVDRERHPSREMPWRDFVTHAVSQVCAAYFDDGQAQLGPDRRGGLYPSWLRQAACDHAPRLLMGLAGFRDRVRALPARPAELIEEAIAELEIPEEQAEAYLTALLMSVNGWAAWCAYLRWQARLAGQDDDRIEHLLAIRVAWELILFRARGSHALALRWSAAIAQWPAVDASAREARRLDWLLQRACEIAYQEPLCRALGAPRPDAAKPSHPPSVQMAFCIDVRSEVFRRALEASDASVATLGFAGFFGLPIEYRPLASELGRPQLPGLLSPTLRASDVGCSADLPGRRVRRLERSRAWKQFKTAAVSSFSFVESLGLLYAAKLAGDALGLTRPVPNPESAGLDSAENRSRKPRIAGRADGEALAADDRVALAAGILRAMSLTNGFARLVVLAGHGSESRNNPHAAGLDCGACCGQTGEVNARAVAALLNDRSVRDALRTRGIVIPESTHFLAALHNTTTDRVALFDLDELPPAHGPDLGALERSLEAAGGRARAERAERLGLAGSQGAALERALDARARDWAQVRPEWGLANNAAFIVAPRERTRHLDLAGRSFLHEYRWQEDADFSVLELIMTAPMIVTHWINLQYYASTVDNARYGSGNKVLHNVVGGHLGVFEGNGGDLRIGLSLQSLHDGDEWVHTPLRLSVFIEAPRSAIDRVLERNERIRQLVANGWLYLFQLDGENAAIARRSPDGWVSARA